MTVPINEDKPIKDERGESYSIEELFKAIMALNSSSIEYVIEGTGLSGIPGPVIRLLI